MLSLSPVKILVVLIVALLVAGPDKLPQIARQMGGAWRTLRTFSRRVEEEVRSTIPDLPSTGDLARYARSPVAILDSLAGLDKNVLSPDPGAQTTAASSSDALIADPAAPAPPKIVIPPQSSGSSGFDPTLN